MCVCAHHLSKITLRALRSLQYGEFPRKTANLGRWLCRWGVANSPCDSSDPTLNSWIELCVQKDWHDQWTVYSNVLWVKKHPNSGSWTVVDGWMYRNVLMYILGVSSLRVQRSIVFNPSIIHGCCSNVSYVSGISSFCAGKLLQERRLVDLLPSSWRSPAAGFGADDGVNASSEEGGHCDCSHQGYCD